MLSHSTGSGEHIDVEIDHTRQVLALLNVERVGGEKRRAIEKSIGKTRRANLRVNSNNISPPRAVAGNTRRHTLSPQCKAARGW
jgi:hypothetical protein